MKISLERLGKIEGSELGEYWEWLAAFEHRDDMMSDEFKHAYYKELEKQKHYAQECFKIKKEVETYTRERYILLEEHYDDGILKLESIEIVDE